MVEALAVEKIKTAAVGADPHATGSIRTQTEYFVMGQTIRVLGIMLKLEETVLERNWQQTVPGSYLIFWFPKNKLSFLFIKYFTL